MKDFASYTGDDLLAEAQRMAEGLDGTNERDLVRAIYDRAAEGRRDGTLTDAQIDAFCARFAPMLDGAKRKKLYRLAAELKKL